MKAPYAYELEAIKTNIVRVGNHYPDDLPDFISDLHDYLHAVQEEYDNDFLNEMRTRDEQSK